MTTQKNITNDVLNTTRLTEAELAKVVGGAGPLTTTNTKDVPWDDLRRIIDRAHDSSDSDNL